MTLNGADRVDQRSVIATMQYEHPIYTPESVAAGRRLPELNDGTARVRRALTTAGASTRTAALPGSRAAAALGVTW